MSTNQDNHEKPAFVYADPIQDVTERFRELYAAQSKEAEGVYAELARARRGVFQGRMALQDIAASDNFELAKERARHAIAGIASLGDADAYEFSAEERQHMVHAIAARRLQVEKHLEDLKERHRQAREALQSARQESVSAFSEGRRRGIREAMEKLESALDEQEEDG